MGSLRGGIWIWGFVTAAPWCAMVTAAFAGWGDLLLAVTRQRRTWLAAFCVGLPLVVGFGGVLNLAHEIHPRLLIAVVLVGAAVAAVKLFGGRFALPGCWRVSRYKVWIGLLVLVCVVLLLVRVAASVHRVGYQYLDDLSEYLTFPRKMLQMHYFAADPFSERRIINSVGPVYFLQGLVVAAMPLNNVQMADTAVGLLLMVVLLLVLMSEWGVRPLHAGVAIVFALVALESTFNLSFTTMPSAMMVAMVAAGSRAEMRRTAWKLGLMLGGLAAVTVGLKSAYLPHAVLLCVVYFAICWWKDGWRYTVAGWVSSAVGFLVVLGPWMLAMKKTSGTYLYPVLGHGDHYTSYYKLESLHGLKFPDATVLGPMACILVEVGLVIWLVRRAALEDWFARSAAVCALAAASLVGSVALFVATGGDSAVRYNFPCVMPAMILLYVLLASLLVRASGMQRVPVRLALGFSLVPLVLSVKLLAHQQTYGATHPKTEAGALVENFAAGFHAMPLPNVRQRGEYIALEEAIPAGSQTLTTLTTPYFLDFSKRTMYLAGFPGAASLPPGWPIHGSGDDLAAYLLAHSIRYLAYSYGDSANYSDAALHDTMAIPNGTSIIRNEAYVMLEAHRQYGELAESRRRVFDDGQMYVLDLAVRQGFENRD